MKVWERFVFLVLVVPPFFRENCSTDKPYNTCLVRPKRYLVLLALPAFVPSFLRSFLFFFSLHFILNLGRACVGRLVRVLVCYRMQSFNL